MRRAVSLGVLAAWGALGSGCFGLFTQPSQQKQQQSAEEQKATAQSRVDDALIRQHEQAVARFEKSPTLRAAVTSAGLVGLLHDKGVVDRKGLDSSQLVTHAETRLEAGLLADKEKTKDGKTMVLMARGGMLLAAGRAGEAVALLEEAFVATPKAGVAGALLAAYDKTDAPKEKVADVCAKARPQAKDDEALFGLLHMCIERLGREDLPFPKAKQDLAFYDAESARQAEENAQRRAEEQARSERRRAEMDERRRQDDEARAAARKSGGGSSGSSSSGGSSHYSVTLKNECGKSVRLFFGQKPKFGSGTYSSIGSNTIQSKSGSVGDMIWIVDGSDNGISSYSPRSGSQNVVITQGCSGFASR